MKTKPKNVLLTLSSKLAIPTVVTFHWKVVLAPASISLQERDFAVREVRRAETALCYS